MLILNYNFCLKLVYMKNHNTVEAAKSARLTSKHCWSPYEKYCVPSPSTLTNEPWELWSFLLTLTITKKQKKRYRAEWDISRDICISPFTLYYIIDSMEKYSIY